MTTITVIGQDVALKEGTSVPVSSLIENISGDAFTQYDLVNLGGGSGHFMIGSTIMDNFAISAADIGDVRWQAGTTPGRDTIQINVVSSLSNPAEFSNVATLFAETNTDGSQVIHGTAGNDVFSVNPGKSEEDIGDGGHDTAIIPIFAIGGTANSSYKPFIDSTGLVRFSPPIISAGSITFAFSGVESVQFNDKTFFIENSDNSNIARLYSAAFDRVPDAKGLFFWEDVYANNVSPTAKAAGYYVALAQTDDGSGVSIADGFMQSSEFINRYGTQTNTGFVDALYLNVLGRLPDQAGLNFWTDQLSHGTTRAVVLVGFAESPENVAKTAADWLIQV